MPLETKQTPLFEKQFKKLYRNEQKTIISMVEGVREDPPSEQEHHLVGDLKCCNSVEIPNLSGSFRLIVRVLNSQNLLHLIAVGPHRTVYEETTRYVKETKLYR